MKFDVEMKIDEITPGEFAKALSLAMFAEKEQVRTDCNFYVRADSWTMRNTTFMPSGTTSDADSISICWNTDYAERVYNSGTPSHDENPNASLRWAEVAEQHFGETWREQIRKGIVDALNK